MSTKRGRGNRGRQDDGEGAHGHIPRPRSLPGLKNGHGRNKIQRVGRKHTKMVSISVSLSTPRPSVNDLEENVKRIQAGLGTESWARNRELGSRRLQRWLASLEAATAALWGI